MTATCSCSRPVTDHAFLCRACTETVERHLAEMPALAADIDVTRTRTSRTGGRDSGVVARSSERPVPWDDRARRVGDELRVLASTWSRLCLDFRVVPPGPTCGRCDHGSCGLLRSFRPPVDTIASMSAYLLASLPALRHRPEVVELADELDRFAKRAAAVIDRPAEQTYFGPCGSLDYWPDGHPVLCSAPCEADLYGDAAATELRCSTCGAEHDVTTVRAYLLGRAQDQLVTAADLSKFLSAYGEPLSNERVRTWVARQQIAAHGKDRAGRPLYRVSEALDVLSRMATRGRRTA